MRHTAYISTERKGFGGLWLTEIIGIAVGATYAVAAEIPEKLGKMLCPVLYDGTLMDVFSGTFTILATLLAAAFLSGFFAFGQASAVGISSAAGALLGAEAAMLYTDKGFAAIPTVLAVFLPKALAISTVTVLSARETFRSSAAILRCLIGREPNYSGLRLYCVKFIVLILISLIISAADALLNYVSACLV